MNSLAFALIILSSPLLELVALVSRVRVSMPVEESLAIDVIAFFLTIAGLFQSRSRLWLWGCAIFASWFFMAGIVTLVVERVTGARVSDLNFLEYLLPLAALTALAVALVRASPSYRSHIGIFAAAVALLLCQTVTACLLELTVRDIPDVYDLVLYHFDGILGLGGLSAGRVPPRGVGAVGK